MAVDLGIRGWTFVGLVDGHALVTHAIERRSRWVDLNAWPGTLLPVRDEWTRAVCAGGALVGTARQTVHAQRALDKRRTELRLPSSGFRAIGNLGGKLVVVPELGGAPLIHDGTWRPLAGEGGRVARAAVVGDFVIWGGRVLRYDGGALVATAAGELPSADDPGYVPTADGFITCGDGKLVIVARHGERRDDVAVGELAVVHVLEYDARLIVFDGHKHHWRDGEPVDFGSSLPDPPTLIPAPCGLIALVDSGRSLVRIRM